MKKLVVETDGIEKLMAIEAAVRDRTPLYCVKLTVNRDITSLTFREEWQTIPLVVYPSGLGAVKDLIGLLPLLKKLNVKFFFDGEKPESYEAVQILSSLGIYSGIVINEKAIWEKLTDVMYYALYGRVPHAPIEPFRYVYDMYAPKKLVDYGTVYLHNPILFEIVSAETYLTHPLVSSSTCSLVPSSTRWQKFFHQATPCAACEGWRICLGKYANMKDKTKCSNFTTSFLQIIETLKYKS